MFRLSTLKYKDILDIKELKIEENKITCIVGKSGSGKTTLLKLLNNMVSYDKGSLKFKGEEITDYNPVELRREIVMLPQNPVMFPGTIKDNFIKTLEYTKGELPQEEQVYRNLLSRVDLNQKLEAEAEKLSGGEKQRLALARILMLKPEILLLDEPSSALDEDTENFIIQMVVDYIKEKSGTLIMVTHSRSIADKYGEIIINMKNGQIEDLDERRQP